MCTHFAYPATLHINHLAHSNRTKPLQTQVFKGCGLLHPPKNGCYTSVSGRYTPTKWLLHRLRWLLQAFRHRAGSTQKKPGDHITTGRRRAKKGAAKSAFLRPLLRYVGR
jgi:hypothetical protein